LKNIILFIGVILGTVGLVVGGMAIGHGDPNELAVSALSALLFCLAAGPGQRFRDIVRRGPDA
jgi:uncharacterized membrane protein YdjX (TVP38/TMEM64 family)